MIPGFSLDLVRIHDVRTANVEDGVATRIPKLSWALRGHYDSTMMSMFTCIVLRLGPDPE